MFLLLPIFGCYFFLIYLFVTAKVALPKKSLVFVAGQITNNLSSIAKNCNFMFWPFAKYHEKERHALQCFLCLFCACFALLKTDHSNRNLIKKGLKIESFLQKTQKFFCLFF